MVIARFKFSNKIKAHLFQDLLSFKLPYKFTSKCTNTLTDLTLLHTQTESH
jgi:hypothetical protein